MLSKSQQALIRNIATKKRYREESGFFIVEGEKFVHDAGDLVEFTFTSEDLPDFSKIISTETPQNIAAVVRTPKFEESDIASRDTILVLDGVQDPGNVGTILRGCLGFNASVILVEAADPTNPKTVRSSAAAVLRVPWMRVSRVNAPAMIERLGRPVFRVEKRPGGIVIAEIPTSSATFILGSEGQGVTLPVDGISVVIPHDDALESLNVGVAANILLYSRYSSR